MNYLTAAKAAEDFFIEKKSKFIGSLRPVTTEEEAIAFINEIKAQHPQARHHVYAYILRKDNTMRYSDAGEPSGTGGQPMLGVLRREELTDICVVATRYFGGILLGAGGLTRAYAKAAKIAVDAAGILEMRMCKLLTVECPYATYDRLCAALTARGGTISDAQFGADVSFTVSCAPDMVPALTACVQEISAGVATCIESGEKFIGFLK